MEWFTKTFGETSIAWLVIFTSFSLISGFISSSLTYRFVKRQEMLDAQKLEGEKQKRERILREVIRWSNPVLSSVQSLQSQLRNILKQGGYAAMSKGYKPKTLSGWSISYEYFMNSLLFLFGQYFAWIRMMQDEMNFELFESQAEKDGFFRAVHKVNHALSTYPPTNYQCKGKDMQVFSLQQRAMGELLIIRENTGKRCMSYPEFLNAMKNKEFKQHFQPLIALLDGIRPDDECRWKRLHAMMEELENLEKVCKELLNIQG